MADIEEIIKENKENKPWGLSPYRMDKNWFEERIDEYATLGLDYIFLGSADITSAGYDYITNRGFVIRVRGAASFQERIKSAPINFFGKERYNDGVVIPKGVVELSEELKKIYPVVINSYEHLAEHNERTDEAFYAELARREEEAKAKEKEALSISIVKEVPLAEDKCIIARIIEKLFG